MWWRGSSVNQRLTLNESLNQGVVDSRAAAIRSVRFANELKIFSYCPPLIVKHHYPSNHSQHPTIKTACLPLYDLIIIMTLMGNMNHDSYFVFLFTFFLHLHIHLHSLLL